MDQPQPTRLTHTRNPVAAYAELPTAHFRDQEPNERIYILLRRHFITNFRWIFLAALGIALPTILRAADLTQVSGLEVFTEIPQGTQFLAEMLWYVALVGYALQHLLSWYFNVYLVTNMRVLDVDFVGLLSYSSTEAELRQIQDVSHKQAGLWQLLFNYGRVEIQTAGIRQNLMFEKIPKPNRVADIVTDLLPSNAPGSTASTTPVQADLVVGDPGGELV